MCVSIHQVYRAPSTHSPISEMLQKILNGYKKFHLAISLAKRYFPAKKQFLNCKTNFRMTTVPIKKELLGTKVLYQGISNNLIICINNSYNCTITFRYWGQYVKMWGQCTNNLSLAVTLKKYNQCNSVFELHV